MEVDAGWRADAGARDEVDRAAERKRAREDVGEHRRELPGLVERHQLCDLGGIVDHPVKPEGEAIGQLQNVQRVGVVGDQPAADPRLGQVREAAAARRRRGGDQQHVPEPLKRPERRRVGRIQHQLKVDARIRARQPAKRRGGDVLVQWVRDVDPHPDIDRPGAGVAAASHVQHHVLAAMR